LGNTLRSRSGTSTSERRRIGEEIKAVHVLNDKGEQSEQEFKKIVNLSAVLVKQVPAMVPIQLNINFLLETLSPANRLNTFKEMLGLNKQLEQRSTCNNYLEAILTEIYEDIQKEEKTFFDKYINDYNKWIDFAHEKDLSERTKEEFTQLLVPVGRIIPMKSECRKVLREILGHLLVEKYEINKQFSRYLITRYFEETNAKEYLQSLLSRESLDKVIEFFKRSLKVPENPNMLRYDFVDSVTIHRGGNKKGGSTSITESIASTVFGSILMLVLVLLYMVGNYVYKLIKAPMYSPVTYNYLSTYPYTYPSTYPIQYQIPSVKNMALIY